MLSNGAPMNLKVVAQLLRTYFSQAGRLNVLSEPGSNIFTAALSSDFIRGAVTRVLDRLVEEYANKRDAVGDTLIAYCLIELRARGVKLDHITYAALKTGFHREDLILQVPGLGHVELQDMNPATGKVSSISRERPKDDWLWSPKTIACWAARSVALRVSPPMLADSLFVRYTDLGRFLSQLHRMWCILRYEIDWYPEKEPKRSLHLCRGVSC